MKTTHTAKVKWSEEDKCFVGTCPSLFLGGVHGDDINQVTRELNQVIQEWLQRSEAS